MLDTKLKEVDLNHFEKLYGNLEPKMTETGYATIITKIVNGKKTKHCLPMFWSETEIRGGKIPNIMGGIKHIEELITNECSPKN